MGGATASVGLSFGRYHHQRPSHSCGARQASLPNGRSGSSIVADGPGISACYSFGRWTTAWAEWWHCIGCHAARCSAGGWSGLLRCDSMPRFYLFLRPEAITCMRGASTENNPHISSLRSLVNSTGYRVLLHEYSNNTGSADCLDHGECNITV